MACVTEALGLTLPGMATAHARTGLKNRLAEWFKDTDGSNLISQG